MTYKHVEQWRSKRFPGISARLRVLSYAQLMRLQEAIEPSVERIEKASAPYIETSRPMTPAERQEYLNTAEIPNDVLRKVAVESSKIDAAYLRAGLVDFSGGLDGSADGVRPAATRCGDHRRDQAARRPVGGRTKKLTLAFHFSWRAGSRQRRDGGEWECGRCKAAGDYRRRNCRKYFPELYRRDHPVVWVSPADRSVLSTECPVSAITGASGRLVGIFSVSQQLRVKALPGSLLAWPARMVEAFRLMASELRKIRDFELKLERERIEQEMRMRQRMGL